MLIKPSTALRNEYGTISDLCLKKRETIFLTRNGEGELVVMSIETYQMRDEMLDLREKLLNAEEKRIKGAKTYSLEEVDKHIMEVIDARKED